MSLTLAPIFVQRTAPKIIDNTQLMLALDKAKSQCQDKFVTTLAKGDDFAVETLTHKRTLIDYCKAWIAKNKGIAPDSVEVQEFKYKLLNAGIDRDIVAGWLSGLGK